MADELLDIIDKENRVVGQEMKTKVHEKGLPHRVAAILLQNDTGEYLIPTASSIKVEAGGLFHSAAGHVPSGEDYKAAAKRELWEETGLRAEEKDFESLGSYWLEKEYPTRKESERFEVFRIKYNPKMGKILLNDEQINEQWISIDKLKKIEDEAPNSVSFPLHLTLTNILLRI